MIKTLTDNTMIHLFSNFVHTIMDIKYDISRHDAIWIVDNQLWVVKCFASFAIHAVISIGRFVQLHIINIDHMFHSGQNLHQKHGTVGLDSLGIVMAF